MIRTIILKADDLPVDYIDALKEALHSAAIFFSAYGMDFTYNAEPEVIPYPNPVLRLHPAQLWQDVCHFLVPSLGDDQAVVLVQGWVAQGGESVGWGGNPIAMAGQYVIDRLRTVGTPEAIMDDGQAAGVLAHEIGHVLGFGHETLPNPNIMWHWWLWPEVYPSRGMTDKGRARTTLAAFEPQMCPVAE